MRGSDERSGALFSYVDLEARVRRNHPLRAIRGIVNEALVALERDFAALGSDVHGRTVRHLAAVDVSRRGDLIEIRVTANAFLRRMVRSNR